MDSSVFLQKMKDLKQKLSSINDDIIEIQKNNKKKNSFIQKDNPINNIQTNNIQINEKLISNQNKNINNEQPLESIINNDILYDSMSPPDTPQVKTNKKIFINRNFYKHLENQKIKKKLEKSLTVENYKDNNYENINKKGIKSRYTYSNIQNLDEEISFGRQKEENFKVNNKLSNILSPSRNPISLRANRKYNPHSINDLNQELNTEQNKIKDFINHKFNDNIMINNNNTICITCDNNNTFQKDGNKIKKKVIPLTRKNNLRTDVFQFYSFISPNNKNLLASKTIYFENKSNKKINKDKKKLNNVSNDYDLLKNETQTYIPNNKVGILSSRGGQFISGKLLKIKKIIKNKENNDLEKNRKKYNLVNLLNKKKNNSLSYNKILLNGNTLINDKSNKLIKIQNKIFNINNSNKNNNVNFDKEKLILKINKELLKKQKKHSSIKNSKTLTDYNNLLYDKKGEKNEAEISQDLINKLNQNIVESKMANNFILKLIKLYYESTGLTINKENDLNSTLTILYNWIENINKKFYFENKKVNEEMQYRMLRQKIMNQYQLKNKKELKDFLFKILGND